MPRTTSIGYCKIDKIIGQTPCLCGDIETWHPKCYAGKTDDEIKKQYSVAYAIARRKLWNRAKSATNLLFKLVTM